MGPAGCASSLSAIFDAGVVVHVQYPKQISVMKQRLLSGLEDDSSLDETGFYMLWNAIFNYHFPLDLGYGVARPAPIAGNGTMPELLIVRIACESGHVVVVNRLGGFDDKTPGARSNVVEELVDCIRRLAKTGYPTTYGIASMDPPWIVLKMDSTDSDQPTTLVPWRTDIVSDESFLALKTVVEIHALTGQVWLSYSVVFWSFDNSLRRLYPHRPPTVPNPPNPTPLTPFSKFMYLPLL